MTDTQNLDKLSDDAKAVLALMFDRMSSGYMLPYMIEVKLDDPVKNLLYGGEGLLSVHYGNGSSEYAHHYGDAEWAVVHIEDDDWKVLDKDSMILHGMNFLHLL